MPTTRRTNSRLVKKEQKKLMRQTVIMVLLTIVLGLAFLFVVLPNIVRITFNVLNTDPVAQLTDDIPPQTPIVTAPVEATHSSTLALTGFGEANSKVVLVLNGSAVEEQTINEEGNFEFEVILTEGENSLVTYSIDEAENESSESKKYIVTFDNQPPELEILEPADGSEITLRKNKLTTIKGTTEPKSKVYVAGRLAFTNSDGEFSTTYNLEEGENKIAIRVEDQAKNVTEQELTVSFKY